MEIEDYAKPYYERTLPDGQVVSADPITFGRARVHIGDGHSYYSGVW